MRGRVLRVGNRRRRGAGRKMEKKFKIKTKVEDSILEFGRGSGSILEFGRTSGSTGNI